MSRSRWPVFLLILALAGGFVFAIWHLFALRFSAGDVYPPYSSLRADPLGTKALHDAWPELGPIRAERNFRPLDKLAGPEGVTLVYAGAETWGWDPDEVEQLDRLMKGGAHVVLTFLPREAREEEESTKKPDATPRPKSTPAKTKETEEHALSLREFAKRWGFSVTYRKMRPPPLGEAESPAIKRKPKLEAHAMSPDLEPTISWHTALAFSNPAEEWHVLYRSDGAPVIMERPFGRGTLAVASDSYFLSNEALRRERAPKLLGRLIGVNPHLLFDEHHLGVEENPGIASLIRQYRLEGLIAAFAALAGLFAWQTMSPLLPPRHERAEGDFVSGKDSASGFISLLRRGVAPAQLLPVCLEQWKSGQRLQKWTAILPRLEATAAAAGRDPVGGYLAIHRILAEKPSWTPAQTKSETR